MAHQGAVWSLCMLLFYLLPFTVASPILDADSIDINAYNNGSTVLSHQSVQSRAEKFYLRVMPFGASITYGDPHPDETGGRGYRKFIRDQLRSQEWPVNMVGSRRYGVAFADNDVEGWPGLRVDELYDQHMDAVSRYKPNLILLNAGTNDATQGKQAGCGDRLEMLIRDCFARSPGVTILASTLIYNDGHDNAVQDINMQYRSMISKLQMEGLKVQLAEMHDEFIIAKDIWDGTHPYTTGCKKMASVWWYAFQQAEQSGWLSPPSDDVDFSDDDAGQDTHCAKTKGSGNDDDRAGMQVLTAGSKRIHDDGTYVHKSKALGRIDNDKIAWFKNDEYQLCFAQLVNYGGADRGGERDDMIVIQRGTKWAGIAVNLGGSKFGDWKFSVDLDHECDNSGIRWGDVNNDGLDDFICINEGGNMYVSVNRGGNPPTFKHVGLYKKVPAGYSREHVRLGDIDGDGRLDYCVINNGGNIHCWRNGGIGDTAAYWQDLGVVFKGKGMGDIAGTRLIDINGDFRADWLWVDNTGKVTTWINQRGSGKGLVPRWREAGVTHGGMGKEVGRDNILFARLYDSGRPDYILKTRYPDEVSELHTIHLDAWQNIGGGGKYQKGDGAHWGDMTGTGNDDYVWIDPEGRVVIFVNPNTPPDTSRYSVGWDDKGIVLETGMDRKALHIGDWNNDGHADIIGVTKSSGALTVWLTKYVGGKFSFEKIEQGGNFCSQGWGVGLFDIGARFHDLTGNGCVDYLCMEPDGRTTAYINNCPKDGNVFNLEWVNQVKYSVNKDRANHHFADVDGDGRADFMWVDKFNGNARVWYNMGRRSEGDRDALHGSIFQFDDQGEVYLGSSRGSNMHYPNLGGLGRADQVQVDPTSGHGWAWFNTCPGGGDDEVGNTPPRDPGLQLYSDRCNIQICCFAPLDLSCAPDEYGQDFSDEDWVPDKRVPDISDLDKEDRERLHKRAITDSNSQGVELLNSSLALTSRGATEDAGDNSLAISPRGNSQRRAFAVEWEVTSHLIVQLWMFSRGYPGSGSLHSSTRGPPAGKWAFRMTLGCGSSAIEYQDHELLTPSEMSGMDTEHNPDLQFGREFLRTLGSGILPNGERAHTAPIDPTALESFWNAQTIPKGSPLPNPGTSRGLDSANEYFWDQFGSQGNRAPMILCEREMNQLKGRIFNLRPEGPIDLWAQNNLDWIVDEAMHNMEQRAHLMRRLRMVIAVFRYMNHPIVRPLIENNIRNLDLAVGRLARRFPADLPGAQAMFREFYPVWYSEATRNTREWLYDQLHAMSDRYLGNGWMMREPVEMQEFIRDMLDEIDEYIKSPFSGGPSPP